MLDQVMPTLDKEMAYFLQKHLEEKGVVVRLKDGVSSFHQNNSSLTVKLNSGNLKSGIYFYTLQVNNEFVTTRRMVIIR